jgi:selenocysteine lyase/cysteine desulfurase
MGVDGATRASLALYSLDHDVDALLNGLSELIGGKLRLAEG